MNELTQAKVPSKIPSDDGDNQWPISRAAMAMDSRGNDNQGQPCPHQVPVNMEPELSPALKGKGMTGHVRRALKLKAFGRRPWMERLK